MMKTALYEWLVISLYVLYKLAEQTLKLSSRLLCILDRNRRTSGEMELAKIAKSLVRCVTTGEVRVQGRIQEFWLGGAWIFFQRHGDVGRLKAPIGFRATPWWGPGGEHPGSC